jgi:plastocyanin
MSKLLLGIIVLVLGGLVGWMVVGKNPKAPSMFRIGSKVTPTPTQSLLINPFATTSPSQVGTDATKGGIVNATTITYTDSGYTPTTVTVKKGTKVTFTNTSSSGMWTASASHPTHQVLPEFDQKRSVGRGSSYEFTFDKVGTWQYHNHVKASDTGVVVVTD